MSLEMRTECERCNTTIGHAAIAFICSHECTFCQDCSDALDAICPNCGGELLRRPRRATTAPNQNRGAGT